MTSLTVKEMRTSSKRLIQFYCLPYLSFFPQNFLINIKNLSVAAILILEDISEVAFY